MKTQKRPPHRPKKYDPSMNDDAYRLALLGLTDEEIGKFFGASRASITRYKRDYPDFAKAVEAGKLEADSRVSESLYKRAVGCKVLEVKTKTIIDEDGNEQMVETVKTESELPPDVTACTRWLVNRRPKNWRQRVDVPLEVNVQKIDWEALREITKQAVEQAEKHHREVIQGRYERLGLSKDYKID
ncbi:hypothetical protein [Methylotuvimicrobium sp. KM2]|uniref:hypothetical protein n=1 Tax=Methylotuvimicrobium sp. KM2 TaxID=3133976 RepID=UPI00310190DC